MGQNFINNAAPAEVKNGIAKAYIARIATKDSGKKYCAII
jgi:hypothetical protein